MAFWSRRKDKEAEPAAPPPESEDEAEAEEQETSFADVGGYDDAEAAEHEASFGARASAVIPGGASTGSKRAEALYGEGARGPTHYIAAHGCRVVTAGEDELIDCTMALGAVALGYADEAVNEAVMRAVARGTVSGLSPLMEVDVAERLCDVIPCAERVRFLKSGAEGVAAAVRIARTHTGRSKVIASGYFGWLDWSSDAAGVPAGVRADVTRVPFDDEQALSDAVARARGDLAAVVLEPVVEREPSAEWLRTARRLCDDAGAVLIFDEVKTGFRFARGGYQETAEVTPDLAVFGKALANGFPLSAVVGRAAVMEAATRTWISSTLAAETTALAAASAVLDRHEKEDVCAQLRDIGEAMRGGVERALAASRLAGVRVEGPAPMWFLRFDDASAESRWLALARREGVLFKRGPYNFASLAHDEATLSDVESTASTAFVALRDETAEHG